MGSFLSTPEVDKRLKSQIIHTNNSKFWGSSSEIINYILTNDLLLIKYYFPNIISPNKICNDCGDTYYSIALKHSKLRIVSYLQSIGGRVGVEYGIFQDIVLSCYNTKDVFDYIFNINKEFFNESTKNECKRIATKVTNFTLLQALLTKAPKT